MIGKVLTGLSSKALGGLTNPASSEEIISGKEAYDNDGNKITGTLEALNNPWKPSTESDYNAIVASKNRVGNYIEYAGKTTKVMPATFSGVFDIGDTVTDVWFDTSITPSTPFFTEWDVTGISYGSKYYRVKYLMAGDGTWTLGDTTLKQGIMIIANESDGYAWSIYYGYPYGEDHVIYSNSASDFLIKGWIFDYNTELETKVTFDSGLILTTLLSSGYSWNGYFAFKNRNAQYGKQYYPLTILTNEGTAADLAWGKQLINSQGGIVTGAGTGTKPKNVATEDEMDALLDDEKNIGVVVKYTGATSKYNQNSLYLIMEEN